MCRSTSGPPPNQKSFNCLCVDFSKDSSLACVSNSTFRLSGSANHGRGDVLWCRSIMTAAGVIVQEVDLEIKDVWFCHKRNCSSTEDWNSLCHHIYKKLTGELILLLSQIVVLQSLNPISLKKIAVSLSASHPLKLANMNPRKTNTVNSKIHNSRFSDPNWSFLQHFRCWSFSVKEEFNFCATKVRIHYFTHGKKGKRSTLS